MMIPLERNIGCQAVGEFVHQRSPLGLDWTARAEEHRSPAAFPGVVLALVVVTT